MQENTTTHLPGSIWVCPSGVSYRLIEYTRDWASRDGAEFPIFSTQNAHGVNSVSRDLPDDAQLIWKPSAQLQQAATHHSPSVHRKHQQLRRAS
ncbi:hypothetical protein [Humidisolicoccus flavus]|uniref:hypothetical protein n=1 Tax=Humidisolicoccus flavus TaxID=3111414 RepID=UPI00324A4847